LQRQVHKALNDLIGEDQTELVKELIQTYLAGGTTLVAELQAAVAQANPSRLEQAAHSLKSSSASLGATVVAELCYQLEQSGRAGKVTEVAIKIRQVIAEYAVLVQALNGILEELSAPASVQVSVESSIVSPVVSPAIVIPLSTVIKTTLVNLVGEDEPAIIADLIQAYMTDSQKLMENLRLAINSKDYNQLLHAAHSLKSSTGNLGAVQLASLFQTLEYQSKKAELTNGIELLAQIESEYQLVIQALRQLQDEISSPVSSFSQAVPLTELSQPMVLNKPAVESEPPTNQADENSVAALAQEIKNTLVTLIGDYDRDLVNDLAQTYQSDSKELMNTIRQAVVQGNADVLAKAAHPLKSSSANLGATDIAKLALALEKKGKAQDMSETPLLLSQLEVTYSQVCVALDRLIEGDGNS
jgi:HPt (histidine-containing phosphotransfer) domain-containing protein